MPATSSPSPSFDLLDRVRVLPPDRGGLRQGEAVIVGLSGGVDSVALLDLLHRLAPEFDLTLAAAHLDHGLREESREDAVFCARLAQERGIPFRTRRIEVADVAAHTGLGLEAAGRQARHGWLEEVRAAEGADRIALGHHLDDHVETLLLWLFRGTGLAGMRGIPAVRDRLVRPLREFRRHEILRYASGQGLSWVDDLSNASDAFLRNRVRREILPRIEEVFDAGAPARLAGFARRLEQDLDALEGLGRRAVARARLDSSAAALRVRRSTWLSEVEEIQLHALRAILAELPADEPRQRWNEEGYQRVLRFAREGGVGKRTPLPGGGWLRIRRNELVFEPADRPEPPPASRFRLVEELLPPSREMVTFFAEDWACFDADSVCPPLSLRQAQPGDRMRPMGMSGHKKLTALYREHHVPAERRPSMLVVADAERIIWAVGVSTAEETRVSRNTKRILKLSLKPVL